MSTPLVSFVIPTFNGGHRMEIPLRGIARQTLPDGAFEVLVIDNASTDGTRGQVESHPLRAALEQRGVSLRVISEPQAGASFARIRGILESRAELVCFLDDDNEPEPEYGAAGVEAMRDPQVGVLVSRLFARWEVPPSPSIARRQHLLAINESFGDRPIVWAGRDELAPTVTAGMWVRRGVFLQTIPWRNPEQLMADRIGNTLTGGGDLEFGYLIGQAGYKRVYVPALRLLHHIPASRLRTWYMCRLVIGTIRSEVTFKSRFGFASDGFGARAQAALRLLGALFAAPALLVRPDGVRELLFVIAARWARVRGRFPGSSGGHAVISPPAARAAS